MSTEHTQLLVIKGLISDMSPEQKEKIEACKKEVNDLLTKYGDEGLIALAYIGMEQAIEQSK